MNQPHNGRNDTANLSQIAREAMIERGLEPEFSREATEQVARIPGPAQDGHLLDLRKLLWCSIDNDDSRDLDQLNVAEKLANGNVRVRVAVADVDALVAKGTPVDDHARQNTTSVYTPTRIFPMLPERLSTDLTSLNPDQDRIAMVVSYEVDANGAVQTGTVERALVHNWAKLAYDSVGAWLEDKGPMPAAMAAVDGLPDVLRLQDDVAQRLKQRRHEEGALDLDTVEAHAVVADGRVVDLQPNRRNRARDLIEDFMVASNGVTARFLESKGFPSVRRVVREPKRWDRLVALALEHGDQLPAAPNSKALSAFLTRRRQADPLRFPDVSLSVVKLLGRGEYVLTRSDADQEGHFGLAVGDYVHSTAPNRRFPDLITHRLLKAAIGKTQSPYSDQELAALAEHCTRQEDAAEKVERRMRKSAAALLLSSQIGRVFDAIVTGAGPKGTWVRTLTPPAEGRLMRGTEGVDVGDRLRVRLLQTNVRQGFVDFDRA